MTVARQAAQGSRFGQRHTDFHAKLIPDRLTYPGTVIAVLGPLAVSSEGILLAALITVKRLATTDTVVQTVVCVIIADLMFTAIF